MSIVAWKDGVIAADKQATNSGLRHRTTKMRRLPSGEVLAWTGEQAVGLMVAKWYEEGADPEKWPKVQEDKERWSRLIVASIDGVKVFEQEPIALRIEDSCAAWGSGRDYALGAMASGASARSSVEIASKFDISCGLGVDEEVL